MQILPLVGAPGVLCGIVVPPGTILEGSGTVFVPPGIIVEGSGTVIDVAVEFEDGGGVEFKDGGGTLLHGSGSVLDVEEDRPIPMLLHLKEKGITLS